jgi:T5SS/PEP-CTERM-associated repeat protein
LGARLDVDEFMKVGNGGVGALTANTGAEITCQQLQIGLDPKVGLDPIWGNVQLLSPRTLLTVRNRLNVGYQEVGSLLIRDGSRLEFLGDAMSECDIGSTRNGSGSLAVVGSNAVFSAVNAILSVGNEGDATLEISKGGRATNFSARIGAGDFSVAQALVGNKDGETNSTSVWKLTGKLEVGLNNFGTLSVLDGGIVQASDVCLGCNADSMGNALVTGKASLSLTNSLRIAQGARTPACVFGVDRGASVTLDGSPLEVGVASQSQGLLVLSLPGTSLVASNALTRIGVNGYGQADVILGAQLVTGAAELGVELPSTGVVYVGGSNAMWSVNGPLTVGIRGEAFLTVDAGGEVIVNGLLTSGDRGRISGSGKITSALVASSGTTDPGGSAGTLTVNGGFTQNANGTLQIEIAGAAAGTLHDVLTVNGNASISGKLSIRFIDGFAPRQGQVFRFLNAGGTVSGNFANVEVTGVAPGFQYQVSRTTDNKGFQLTASTDGVATSQPEPARIAIERIGPNVAVSWTAPTGGYVIQSRTNLFAGDWIDRTTIHRLDLLSTNTLEFFRLIKR